MFVARWIIDARFGHKDEAIALCRRWQQEVGERAGLKRSGGRMLTGSIGAAESRLESEYECASIADLEKSWAEMAKNPSHVKFSRELEPHIVSGSNRWEILRVLDS